MKSAVVFKWARDPQDARVSVDGELVWGNAKLAATDDDIAAMDAALAAAGDDEVVGVTVGDGKPDWAAARGAARTVLVENPAQDADAAPLARQVAAAIRGIEGVEFAAVGDSDWSPAFVSALAGELGWNTAAGVIACEPVEGGVRATCKGAGESRVIELPFPAFIAAKALSKEANPPGMKQTLAARKKPVDKLEAEELSSAGESLTAVRTVLPESTGAQMFDAQDLDAACKGLADALRNEGVL
ncbi:MAG: hypothetical protein ACI36V_06265 [Coriobacteriales bacterium]